MAKTFLRSLLLTHEPHRILYLNLHASPCIHLNHYDKDDQARSMTLPLRNIGMYMQA